MIILKTLACMVALCAIAVAWCLVGATLGTVAGLAVGAVYGTPFGLAAWQAGAAAGFIAGLWRALQGPPMRTAVA